MEAAKEPGIRDLADDGMGELPPREDLLRSAQEIFTYDRDHPLLRLRDHDLPRLQLLAQGHAVEVDVDAGAVARHLRERGREPGGAAVLERLDQPLLDQLDGDLDQLLAGERVADLHRRPLLGRALAELLAREHACAADPVSAGRRAVEDEQMPGRPRLRARDALGRQQPDAHRVHQAVVRIGLVEERLAADGWDADPVAVGADSGHRSVERVPGLAEAQPVEQRHRPRAHRDDVSEDPADPGRRALEGLDCGRVVVRLDLEGNRLAVAEVEHARVLARPLEHALALAREPLQQQRRVLVAAVLRPEQREHRQLEVVRVAAHQLADTVELPVGETERAVERFRDLAQEGSLSSRSGWAEPARIAKSASYREARRRRPRYREEMSRRYGPLILTLAAIWGSSYLFIKVGVRDFEPTVLMTLRLLIGGLLLLAFLAVTRVDVRRSRRCAEPGATASCSARSTARSRSR